MPSRIKQIRPEILRAMLEQATISAWLIDAEEKILFTNDAAVGLTGYSVQELVGSPVSTFIDPGLGISHAAKVFSHAEHGGDSRILGQVQEFDIVRKDGSTVPIELKAFELPQTLCGQPLFGAFISDNSRHKKVEAEMARLARQDYLTGYLNRLGFMERAVQELSRARRSGQPLSLIVMDLDRFKLINDTHGHQGGDAVLAHLLPALADVLRTHDVFGRVGGEEFFILLPETDREAAVAVAERLRKALEDHVFDYNGARVAVTASLGCASLRASDDLDQLIQRADHRLYTAKRAGRNRVVAVDPASERHDSGVPEAAP